MKQTITILFFLLLLTGSCSNENRVLMSQLAHIDSLMAASPQAAYDSLRKDSGVLIKDGGRDAKMKYRLLMAKAQNKLFLQMPSDSLFQEVVDYYDSKGTANEKMEAHYLMGCVYRDQHEAPKAIQCYEKAVVCADTLSKDCDFVTLYGVYGQMADIYKKQYLHQEAIKACQKYSDLAARAHDKGDQVKGLVRMSSEYYEMGDTARAIHLILDANRLYNKYGMSQEAVQVYPKLIYTYLRRGQYGKAQYYMTEFEQKSGFFDASRHIQSGKEHYYKAKAMFLLGINQIDSAEYYYRELGRYGFRYESMQGLLSVYSKSKNVDSIAKYSALCESEMDRILNENQTDAVAQASSLFNYVRLQKQLDENALKAERVKFIMVIVALVVLGCLLGLYQVYRKGKIRMLDKMARINDDYSQILEKLEKAQQDLQVSQTDKTQYIKTKQEEILGLKAELDKMREESNKLNLVYKKKFLQKSKTVQRIKQMALGVIDQSELTTSDWDNLKLCFQQWHPVLFDKLCCGSLSEQELYVCMLTYLRINNKQIAYLLSTSTNVVCNAKQKANHKLFEDKSASSLTQNMLEI